MKIRGIGVLLAALLAQGAAAQPDIPSARMEQVQVSEAMSGVCNAQAAKGANQLWFIEAEKRRLGRLDLASGEIRKFALPTDDLIEITSKSIHALPGDDKRISGPCDFVMQEDTRLWFNYQARNSIGYIQTAEPFVFKFLPLPTPASLPMAMQEGGDGKIYVELTAANKIARVDPKTLKIKEFALPEKDVGIIGGAASIEGKAHWFILMNANKILRFEYATGAMKTFDIPTPNAAPFVIRAYDDGLWFTMFGGNAIGHFDVATEKFTEIPLPTPNSLPIGITKGADGFLYAILRGTDEVVRIDRKAKSLVGFYRLISSKGGPGEIKLGPDGAIWVTGYKSGELNRLWLPSFGTDPGFPSVKGDKH